MNTTSDLLESVARAIHMATSDDEPTEYAMIVVCTEARAAILETLRQIREPSERMMFEAVCEYQNHVEGRDPEAMFAALWQAMIDQLISELE